ncbi:MAG: hypothetical protein NC548_12935 [Lachnospiraceae bacterium]|nr:hypothetical protein [Lachnospiraceae bacterium]MCM1230704.1 hypothetical protein [Ruminococcus flavefaciens]
MEKTIKANKDNDLKLFEGLHEAGSNIPENNKDGAKKEGTESNTGNLEYFCE